MRNFLTLAAVVFAAAACFGGVHLNAPLPGKTVSSPVHFNVWADGRAPIEAMIVYVDDVERHRAYDNGFDISLPMSPGWHRITIKAWDVRGGVYRAGQYGIYVSAEPRTVGVTVTSPVKGDSVGSEVNFQASALGVMPIESMIIYIDNDDRYLTYSDALNTNISLAPGAHTAVVKAWERAGSVYQQTVTFTVGNAALEAHPPERSDTSDAVTGGTTVYNVQSMPNWGDCDVCAGDGGNGPAAKYSMEPWQDDPALSGQSAKFSLWGDNPYGAALWWKSIVSSDHPEIVRKAHHFIYDAYFMVDSSDAPQALEFDINQFVNGHSLIFGTQCNVHGGSVWDIWNNRESRWVHTDVHCGAPSAWEWHHVTIEGERSDDGRDWLHYIAITLDGGRHYLDTWDPPADTTWTGITVNFQMDGNLRMSPYTTWVDKLTFSYW